jgi:hypothetical protein
MIAYTRHREESIVAELRRSRLLIAELQAEVERVKEDAAIAVDAFGAENERLRQRIIDHTDETAPSRNGGDKVSHYRNREVRTIDEFFNYLRHDPADDPSADEMNWVFLSTSGVHGSYATLDDVTSDPDYLDEDGTMSITVLIVRPRLVSMVYGTVAITDAHVPILRRLVEETIAAVAGSQAGNMATEDDDGT